MDRTSLVFVVLLTLRADSAADLHNNVTRATPREVTATQSNQTQLPTQELLNAPGTSGIPGLQATPSTRVDANQETASALFPPQTTQTAAAPISSTTSAGMSTAVAHTSGATNATKPPTAPPLMTNSTQSQGSSMPPTSPTPPPSQSTVLMPTPTPSPKPQRTSPGQGAGTTLISSSYKTTSAGARPNLTKPKKRPGSGEETLHGKMVAGLIGGALVVMMLGFLVIYIKKRRLQKQQITSTDWAGPSPFLVGGANDNQVTLRSSNRISLSSFLPQRLSKRLSLLPEADEELQDMSPGGTFGGKLEGSTFGQEVDEKDGEESERSPKAPPPTDVKNGRENNGTTAAPPTATSSGEAEGTEQNSISETS